MEIVYERIGGIDVRKKQIPVAVRTRGQRPGKRRPQLRRYAMFYAASRTWRGKIPDLIDLVPVHSRAQ